MGSGFRIQSFNDLPYMLLHGHIRQATVTLFYFNAEGHGTKTAPYNLRTNTTMSTVTHAIKQKNNNPANMSKTGKRKRHVGGVVASTSGT